MLFLSLYHFTKNNNDFYIGLQPGISITKAAVPAESLNAAKTEGIEAANDLIQNFCK